MDEALSLTHSEPMCDIEAGFSAMVARMHPKEPHIYLMRLDEQNGELGFQWAFLSFVPDGSPVRKRMLFASSRDACKKQLGEPYFEYDLNGSMQSELMYEAFQEYLSELKKPKQYDVMSATEKALVREAVAVVDMGGGNAHSVRFPASDEAKEALKNSGENGLVVLRLDLNKESIELEGSLTISPEKLAEQLNEEEPRYFVYRWHHEHEGKQLTSKVFVYWCPDGAKVKAKMMYSTVKSIAVELAGDEIEARIEINTGDPLTEAELQEAIHPPPAATLAQARNSGIKKPSRPSSSRPRRLIK